MNTKNMMPILFVIPSLMTLSSAQAQRSTSTKKADLQQGGGQTGQIGNINRGPIRTDKIAAEQVDRGYIRPHRKPIVNPNINALPANERAIELQLNQVGYTLTKPNDVWTETPKSTTAILGRQLAVNQLNPDHKVQASGISVSDTYSKTFEAGSQSLLFAEAKFSMTHSGSAVLARLQSDAEIDGAILGDFGNLAKATADFKAPATGTQTAAMNLTVLGQTVWSQNKSGSTATINDGFDYHGKILQVGFDYTIAGFGITAEIWAQGDVNAHFNGTCTPKNVQVNASAGGNLAVDGTVGLDVFLASAKFKGNIVLADVSITGNASTVISTAPSKLPGVPPSPILTAAHNLNDNLSFVKGSAKIEVDVVGHDVADFTIFDDPNGLFHTSGVLENYNKVYPLSTQIGNETVPAKVNPTTLGRTRLGQTKG